MKFLDVAIDAVIAFAIVVLVALGMQGCCAHLPHSPLFVDCPIDPKDIFDGDLEIHCLDDAGPR